MLQGWTLGQNHTRCRVIHDGRRARGDSKVLARSCRNVRQRETDIRTVAGPVFPRDTGSITVQWPSVTGRSFN